MKITLVPRTTVWTYVNARGASLYLDRSVGACLSVFEQYDYTDFG